MDNIEEQIGAVLNNPQLMQQILSMAKSLGQSDDTPPQKGNDSSTSPIPGIDMGTIQKLSGLANQSGIDSNQQTLLHALSPYLSQDRVSRLERAMRAARMARFASSFLGNSFLQSSAGR